jgi:hypothetical protein
MDTIYLTSRLHSTTSATKADMPDATTLRTSGSAFKSPYMFDWLRKRFANKSPLARWSVSIEEGQILTSDGMCNGRQMALSDLTRVVVATDDSGPWGADVVFLLYSKGPDPAGLFPLEANGQDSFVAWMTAQPGYNDRELARAMGSTTVARFEVLTVGQNGS